MEGCSCAASTLDGHHTEKNSQTHLCKLKVSQSDVCVIQVTSLDQSSSGEHKVKVRGGAGAGAGC